jgi:gamma-glutamyltranspeptidase/glutathione hydrolase
MAVNLAVPYHVVAAGHSQTAAAAEAILRDGGNAFDAAVAAMATACVVEPVLASLGGGGFVLACPANGRPRVYDFFVNTPLQCLPQADLDFHPTLADFGTQTQEFHIGRGSIATPGFVAGAFALQRELGRMTMRDLLSPAVNLAKQGHRVTQFQAYLFNVVKPIFLATPECAAIFASANANASANSDCELVREGELLRQELLGDFLENLALEGEALFYRGEVAAALQRDHVNGGQLSRADLECYTVHTREPLKLKVAGVQVLTNPPPSSGGTLCAFGLSLLDAATLQAMGADDVHYQLAIADILQATHEARIEAIAANRATDRAAAANASRRNVLDPALLSRYRHEVMGRLHARRGTTHISIIDAEGNLASVTVSNGEGSGYVVPGTGIVMNNMLGEADLNPGGFQRWVPGQRMTSMMMPSAVRWADGTQVACGSGGSNRIRSALLQVLLRMVVHGDTPQAAVLAPRLHVEDELLSVEGGFDNEAMAPLLAAWPQHQLWESRNLFFGGAHTVRSGPNACDGIGDPRRGGVFVRIPA